MSRRKVYEAVWRLRKRTELLKNRKDRDDIRGILSDLNQGIFGWEQDIKRTPIPDYVRSRFLAGDPITWLDDDLEEDDDDDNSPNPKP
jgi:hypothetical protein